MISIDAIVTCERSILSVDVIDFDVLRTVAKTSVTYVSTNKIYAQHFFLKPIYLSTYTYRYLSDNVLYSVSFSVQIEVDFVFE